MVSTERVSQLTDGARQDLITKMVEKHPQFVFDILTASTNQPQEGHHPSSGVAGPSWCRCSHCREMPTEGERVCCNQIPLNCISRLQDFDLVVLDQVVLAVAQRYRQDVFGVGDDEDYNRGKRHTAYRQFTLWHHWYLGAGNRRVIPSCCVWRIRDKYPDPFGQYRGFLGGRLG
ncbi:P2X purinoceptor 7-like [Mytilus galloprovincialis]|uniref:P2X purinoceptor 7-like n=1 Tax=Mytilus galloprovincialis TaxID=29158 RepID=UPI003F7B5673